MRRLLVSIVLAAAFMLPGMATAVLHNFDYTNLNGGVEGLLANTVSDNNIVASGFNNPGGGYVAAPLWLRNTFAPVDNGLGVCSEGQPACLAGGGEVNEMDNKDGSDEMIRLDKTFYDPDGMWVSLKVSSLDDNDGGGGIQENGLLCWSNSNDPDQAFGGNCFAYNNLDLAPAVEGELLNLPAAAAFDKNADFVFFKPGTGTENDHLVWAGTVETEVVPEPGTLTLLGLGLVGMGLVLRRRGLL